LEGFFDRRRKNKKISLKLLKNSHDENNDRIKKKQKIPIVKIDKSLNKYDDLVLFPDKLEKANEMLRKVGLPKQWTNEKQQS
jgi:hypothetical protein